MIRIMFSQHKLSLWEIQILYVQYTELLSGHWRGCKCGTLFSNLKEYFIQKFKILSKFSHLHAIPKPNDFHASLNQEDFHWLKTFTVCSHAVNRHRFCHEMYCISEWNGLQDKKKNVGAGTRFYPSVLHCLEADFNVSWLENFLLDPIMAFQWNIWIQGWINKITCI